MKNPMQQATTALTRALTSIAADITDGADDMSSSTATSLISDILDPMPYSQVERITRDLATLGHKMRLAQARVLRFEGDTRRQDDALAERDDLHARIQAAAAIAASEWRVAITVAALTEERTEEEQQHLNDLIANPPTHDDDY